MWDNWVVLLFIQLTFESPLCRLLRPWLKLQIWIKKNPWYQGDAGFLWERQILSVKELCSSDGDRRCWDDAQWYFMEPKGCQASGSVEAGHEVSRARTGWSSLIFPFHSFFLLCLISFSLSPSSHLTINGPPTAGWPTIVCEVIL